MNINDKLNMKMKMNFKMNSQKFSLLVAILSWMPMMTLSANESCSVTLNGSQSANLQKDETSTHPKAGSPKASTELLKRIQGSSNVNPEDLRLLYGVNGAPGETPSPFSDVRLLKAIGQRSVSEDLNSIGADLDIHEFSASQMEALSKEVIFHFGSLVIDSGLTTEELQLPRLIGGNFKIRDYRFLHKIRMPWAIGLDLLIRGLRRTEGLKLSEIVGGDLWLPDLVSAKGVRFPRVVNGEFVLDELRTADGLVFPEILGRGVWLGSLRSAKGLRFPRVVKGTLDLSGLESFEGLELPEIVEGSLLLGGLKSARGLRLPRVVKGTLDLSGLRSSEGLELPEVVGEDVHIGYLLKKQVKAPASLGGQIIDAKTSRPSSSDSGGLRLI